MNIHFPQSHGAIFELQTFMSVTSHIVSAQQNAPIIGIVQDGLLGAYVLTLPDTRVSKTVFFDCLMNVKPIDLQEFLKTAIEFYPNDVIRNRSNRFTLAESVSGKLLLSTILKRNFNYRKKTETHPTFPTVIIEKGIMTSTSGPLCKKVLGNKSNAIAHILFNEFSPSEAAEFITNIQFLINRWFPSTGFSVGISDCIIDNPDSVKDTLQKSRIECQEKIEIGSDLLEKEINKILNETGAVGMKLCQSGLRDGQSNRLVTMFNSGAKGSTINVSQITGFVGQQNVRGLRIPKLLSGCKRSLPHFEPDDESPNARGFVDRSYMAGLNPQQTYFHAMGGREGLIDTAVKTAKTGYAQRKIVKKMEDLKLHFDGSVRGTNNNIIEFLYGSDGYDASKLYFVEGELFFIDPVSVAEKLNSESAKNNELPVIVSDRVVHEICSRVRVNKIKTYNIDVATDKVRTRLRGLLKKVKLVPSRQEDFIKTVETKFHRSLAEGGEMVGIIASCCIGEPMTQNTLNSFHFAGISEKDVTPGVQRLQECLDATRKPKTPSCLIYVNDSFGRSQTEERTRIDGLRYVQSLIGEYQFTTVSHLLKKPPTILSGQEDEETPSGRWWVTLFKELHELPDLDSQYVIELEFDIDKMFKFSTVLEDISRKIESDTSFAEMTCIYSPNNIGTILVYIDFSVATEPVVQKLDFGDNEPTGGMSRRDESGERESRGLVTPDTLNFYYTRDIVVKKLCEVQLFGIGRAVSTISTTAITKVFFKEVDEELTQEKSRRGALTPRREWIIDTQGCNFKKVLNQPFTNFQKTICDDFWQVLDTLGIEATRAVMVSEFTKGICSSGSYIDPRHIALLVDSMVSSGTITPVRREGIKDAGPLTKCGFEKVLDNFGQISMFGDREDVDGVSASIIMGKLMHGGTGFSDVIDPRGPTNRNEIDVSYGRGNLRIPEKETVSVKSTKAQNLFENY